jgi:DNA polymerase
LIGADFSAIEAVVLAALAGEDWRLEVFRTHGKIYEMSAAKILGIDLAEFDRYKAEHGSHHPRRKLGKIAELASGYQGGLGAWRNFELSQGVDLGMTDEDIKAAVKSWRAASPAVVNFWGGLYRGGRFDPWGCEGAAVMALENPGSCFAVGRGGPVSYGAKDGVLYCRLPSGRCIVYQGAEVVPCRDYFDRPSRRVIYKTWGSQITGGKKSWIEIQTYGGALVENICQAVARDLQAAALVRLEAAGYGPVLHVHDEIVAEVPKGWGDAEEFRSIMATLPDWAAGWPLRVGAAWRGYRFRK